MEEIFERVAVRLFGQQNPAFVEAFIARIKRVHLKKGDVLYHQGEPGDGMHIIVTGRLQVKISGENEASQKVVAQLGPGEAVGEIALFTGQGRAATLVALRNTTLGFLKREDFTTLMTGHSAAQIHLSNYIIERLLDAQRRSKLPNRRVRSLAVVPLDPKINIRSFCSRLQIALLRFGSVALLDAKTIESRFPKSFTGGTAGVTELERFVDATENSHDYLLLEVEYGPSVWARKSVAYADVIVFVTSENAAKATAEEQVNETLLAAGEPVPELELVIVHPSTADFPANTSEWLALVKDARHLHITLEGESGFERLARFYSGNAVSLVLGGGGALGFAHIGVLRVLREAGVPIDAVGGTSIGGIVAGGIAMGWNDHQMLAEFKKAFVDDHPTDDYTLPVMSLVQGRKMNDGVHHHFGDIRVEDLWIPFFAVSSSLSHNREYIHKKGLLWRALRATASLPGIFPPIIEGADLLVDGGILNNLPVNVMKDMVRGHVIAVDLSAEEDISYEKKKLPTAWEFIKSRIRSESLGPEILTLHNVILQSTMLGSRREVINARGLADLFLNPPTAEFDLLDWQRFHTICEVGYRYARSKVNAWADRHPELIKRGAVSELRTTGTF